MKPIMQNLLKAVLCLLIPLALNACGGSSGSGPTPTPPDTNPNTNIAPFIAVHYKTIDLPPDVKPLYSNWSPDGDQIVISNIVDGEIWLVNADGSNLKCITCNVSGLPQIHDAFAYIFPDKKRLFFSNELGDEVYVIECTPSVENCNTSKAYPVDLTADKTGDTGKFIIGRRTYHLAPDGVHLAYTESRLDAMLMIIGRLVKQGGQYVVKDPKVINPHPVPSGPNDHNVQDWANIAQLYEIKSFANGGASVLFTSENTGFDYDTFKMDLATGEVTRIAHTPDWDEDGAVSPDGKFLELASWRTMHRMDPYGLMPLTKGFFNFPVGAVTAFYYVSSFTGFQCDLQPWLLPGGGDQSGKRVGQPLYPYRGGNLIAANNLVGAPMWSPDSTKVLLREHYRRVPPASGNAALKQKGIPPSRLRIARLDRKPAKPEPAVKTVIGDWAATPATYKGPYGYDHTAHINGSHGGTITVVYQGNLLSTHNKATYHHYSEDGKHFLSGTVSLQGNAQKHMALEVHLTAKNADGKKIGGQNGSLRFQLNPNHAYYERPWIKTGHLHTTWKGKTAASLAQAGPCVPSLPRPPKLQIGHSVSGNALQVRVTSNIHGDKRPVLHALVTVDGLSQKTNASGLASFQTAPSGKFTIEASAGDTFAPASISVTR